MGLAKNTEVDNIQPYKYATAYFHSETPNVHHFSLFPEKIHCCCEDSLDNCLEYELFSILATFPNTKPNPRAYNA
jgi:hypothetical protein